MLRHPSRIQNDHSRPLRHNRLHDLRRAKRFSPSGSSRRSSNVAPSLHRRPLKVSRCINVIHILRSYYELRRRTPMLRRWHHLSPAKLHVLLRHSRHRRRSVHLPFNRHPTFSRPRLRSPCRRNRRNVIRHVRTSLRQA